MIRTFFDLFGFPRSKPLLAVALMSVLFGPSPAVADMSDWKHSGLMYIVTTPAGANLPASALEKNFPLLVRLHGEFFDFSQAKPRGEDVRFTANGKPLSHQIERWDAAGGHADIWVRIPTIKGNDQQAIRMHWGNARATGASNGERVFRTTEGFAGVWHLGDHLEDATANNLDGFDRPDKPTTNTAGIIGDAQEFGINKILVIRPPGAKRDRRVTCMPSGNADRTMSAWVHPTSFEGRNWAQASIGGWGEPERGQKPGMGLSYFTMTGRGQPRFHLYGFDPRCASPLPRDEWRHVALSVSQDMVRFYVDGVLNRTINNNGEAVTQLGTLRTPESTPVDLGDHGNGRGPFNGALDEVRFESVARSDHWLKLCFENQKPLQSLVGPLVQNGDAFSVSQARLTLKEGASIALSAKAGGAQKVYWVLQDGDQEQILAVDRFNYVFHAGRVAKNKTVSLQFKALFASGVKTKTIPVAIQESIPNPVYTLDVPKNWNGRDELVIAPSISNLAEMKSKGASDLNYSWTVSGMATISKAEAGKLVLKRAQNSGALTVKLALDNGGATVSRSVGLTVSEPKQDAWVKRIPAAEEKPVDHQFYARDGNGQGTLHYRGTLKETADTVFLRLYADDKLIDTQRQTICQGMKYAFSAKLKAGLITYRTELGIVRAGRETILHKADDLACGDVYIIQGQSNAEAWTDDRVVHPYRSPWLRSFGTPSTNKDRARDAVWGNALSFNGGPNHHHFQIGYWGVELGKLLIEKHKLPICIINGAQGGTRVDQHQRNEADPTDVTTIYGRLLWRMQQAKLTHGVRAVLWHQGENDQGESGATGTFGWVNYQDLFIRMTAAWKHDYPNIKHYYIHQIWPGACGSRSVENDRLREQQRRLPERFSNMSIMSTLGIRPGGGCHHPPEGYAAMARQLFPLVNKHNYGAKPKTSVTPPNIRSVSYANAGKDEIKLVFDQNVKWDEQIAGRFYLDNDPAKLTAVGGAGKIITLKLAEPSTAKTLTYVRGGKWKQDQAIIRGSNNIAALTFCEVPIQPANCQND
tara:strand:+ start:12791 stop:15901 length:3111 start_codon:yes stop_codon:yes gene_type:complete